MEIPKLVFGLWSGAEKNTLWGVWHRGTDILRSQGILRPIVGLSDGRPGRHFFENWRAALKWQRLTPYEKFAELVDRHWDGIAAYCHPDNKVALGFVEGLNNKIRVIQRCAYGLRDEEYLRLKILTCMLLEI